MCTWMHSGIYAKIDMYYCSINKYVSCVNSTLDATSISSCSASVSYKGIDGVQ